MKLTVSLLQWLHLTLCSARISHQTVPIWPFALSVIHFLLLFLSFIPLLYRSCITFPSYRNPFLHRLLLPISHFTFVLTLLHYFSTAFIALGALYSAISPQEQAAWSALQRGSGGHVSLREVLLCSFRRHLRSEGWPFRWHLNCCMLLSIKESRDEREDRKETEEEKRGRGGEGERGGAER